MVTAIKRIVQYLKFTKSYGLTYSPAHEAAYIERFRDLLADAKHASDGSNEVIAFSDADFAEDNVTFKSVSASIVVYKSVPIAWRSQQQKIRTHSTTHAEMVAACDTIDLLKSQGYLH